MIILFKFFDIKPLNTFKHLNYLAFKEAVNLYFNKDKNLSLEQNITNKIQDLKNSMNTKRKHLDFPNEHEIKISPYWLLGFIEGDACFSVSSQKSFPLRFIITQVNTEQEVLNTIQTFLLNLPGKFSPSRITSNPVQIPNHQTKI